MVVEKIRRRHDSTTRRNKESEYFWREGQPKSRSPEHTGEAASNDGAGAPLQHSTPSAMEIPA
jgi:hypothetical protein